MNSFSQQLLQRLTNKGGNREKVLRVIRKQIEVFRQ